MKRLVLLAVLGPALMAQDYGAVEGTVSDIRSHTGIAGVSVQLRAVDGRSAGYVGTTDASGRFRIDRVLQGDYSASYDAAGYAAPGLAQGAFRPFHVSAGGDPVSLHVELEQLGKLSARVLDEDGNPAGRVPLMLLRLHGGAGAGTGYTDAQGRLTIAGIGPGNYVLLAGPGKRSLLPAHPREGERFTWAPTYYPNALERSQAETIRIRGGSDLSGYVIRLRAAPAYRVSGVVLDDQGAHAAKAILKMLPREDFYSGAEIDATAGQDGRFEFASVTPGEWRISGEGKRKDLILKAATAVTVAGRDVEDVTVRLTAPFVVKGFVDRDEPRDAQGNRKVTAVMLEDAAHVLNASAFHEQDGTLQIRNVYPGRYRITPMGFVPGFYLDSVWLGDRSVMGQEVDLSPSSPPIRVIYKPNAGRVRGTVEDGAGSAVYLLPQDESLLNSQFIRSIACDPHGRFEVGSLRPGDYYAFAFDRVEPDTLTDPAYVQNIAGQAVRVHVEAGSTASVNLRVTTWPD